MWHIIGTIVLIILLPSVAPTHQSATYVFTDFESEADIASSGVPSAG